jgi:hypothetical protein
MAMTSLVLCATIATASVASTVNICFEPASDDIPVFLSNGLVDER